MPKSVRVGNVILGAPMLSTYSAGALTPHSSPDPVGLVKRAPGAFDGYTLYGPLNASDTYLVDTERHVVEQWPNTARPGNSVYLLPNGRLLRTEKSD